MKQRNRSEDSFCARSLESTAPITQTPARLRLPVLCIASASGAGRRDAADTSETQAQQIARTDTVPSAKTPLLLVGERQHRLYPLDPAHIDYIEADHNYVTFWAGATEYISRDTVKRLSTLLTDCGFVRIERSVLINVRAVAYAQIAEKRAFVFTLISGVCLHSSAAYRDTILRTLPLSASRIKR